MIGEERLTTDEFAGDVDYELPEPPGPKEVIEVSGGRVRSPIRTGWIWTGSRRGCWGGAARTSSGSDGY